MQGSSAVKKIDLNKVVQNYGAILDIGLHNPKQVGAVQAQELAQGFRPGREELRPVAQDRDLTDDVARLCIAEQLHITHCTKCLLTYCSVKELV